MPEIGRHTVTIVSHDLTTLGDKPAVKMFVTYPDGEDGDIAIWLSEKSMGIARKSLKLCGFDPDKEDFGILADKQEHLKGRKVDVVVEEYNGKMRAQIALGNTALPKKDILAIQSALRAVKGSKEAPVAGAPAQAPASKPSAPPSNSGPPPADISTDDIPF